MILSDQVHVLEKVSLAKVNLFYKCILLRIRFIVPQGLETGRSHLTSEVFMPKSFELIAGTYGQFMFWCRQDDIAQFLGGPAIVSYEGVCLALVMMWFAQDTSKVSPLRGTINKVRALELQTKMESSWDGFDTVESQGKITTRKNFWYKFDHKEAFAPNKYGADVFLLHDPQDGRESMSILVVYPREGSGHAIGVWRFPTGALVLFDPNHGACVVRGDNFREFLNEFLTECYNEMETYAICAFWGDPPKAS